MLNPDQPLGLPEGSVRALLALGLVGVACYLAIVGTVSADAFLTLAAMAAAFYFGKAAPATPPSD